VAAEAPSPTCWVYISIHSPGKFGIATQIIRFRRSAPWRPPASGGFGNLAEKSGRLRRLSAFGDCFLPSTYNHVLCAVPVYNTEDDRRKHPRVFCCRWRIIGALESICQQGRRGWCGAGGDWELRVLGTAHSHGSAHLAVRTREYDVGGSVVAGNVILVWRYGAEEGAVLEQAVGVRREEQSASSIASSALVIRRRWVCRWRVSGCSERACCCI
jgi:hypothetical protein